jgi:hypothetical protein
MDLPNLRELKELNQQQEIVEQEIVEEETIEDIPNL